MPDIEQRFLQRYGSQGLTVVALNAHDALEQLEEVSRFVGKLGISYPAGLEQTETYRTITENFAGTNPFPVDVVIDRDGRIAYIAREYDPDAMGRVIERLLAR